MNLIVHEGRVGKADPAFPWPDKSRFLPDYDNFEKYNRLIESCLSHATWFDESDNERAVILIMNSLPFKSIGKDLRGPYLVENFPEVEEVEQFRRIPDVPRWNPTPTPHVKVPINEYRTVLQFKTVSLPPLQVQPIQDGPAFCENCDRITIWHDNECQRCKPDGYGFKQEPKGECAIHKTEYDDDCTLCDLAKNPKEEPKTGEDQEELWNQINKLLQSVDMRDFQKAKDTFHITRKQTEQ
jgi:hypothetical protein